MRAGLSTVQQTLTPEAASILNHAIAEACRRGHGQTTPLHVAATLLAAPASHLRQACIRSHPNSSHPLQCRALELCFSVALDRLPAAQGVVPGTEPPISNALMAALKRAQAHQRRGCPEQQQQPLLAVKVELEQLIVSILDDPSVSRVMREASFSSPAVKATIEQSINMANSHSSISLSSSAIDRVGFRFGSSPSILGRSQQHFDCSNRSLERDDASSRPISQRNPYLNPRLQSAGVAAEASGNRNDEIRRLIEILQKVKKRNPVLVGEKEPEAVIKELVQRIEKGETPAQLQGVQILPIETEISAFCTGNKDKDHITTKFRELDQMVEGGLNKGVILNVGDLRWLVEQPKAGAPIGLSVSSSMQQVVTKLGQLLARYGPTGRLWLIGVATCETYLRCQVYHPSMENDWDLQPLPIVAKPTPGLFPRFMSPGIVSNSMESLFPLKGFSSIAPTLKKSRETNDSTQKMNCCSQCMSTYEQELALMEHEKKTHMLSTTSPQSKSVDQGQQALPQWLQIAKSANGAKGPDMVQSKDQEHTWNQKVEELQKKWNEKCRLLHSHFHAFRPLISVDQSQESLRVSGQAIDTNGRRQNDCTVEKSGIQDPHRGRDTFSITLDSLWRSPSQSKCVMPILTQNNGTVVEGITRSSVTQNAVNGRAHVLQSSFGGRSCELPSSLPGSCLISSPNPSPVATDLALGRSSVFMSSSCNPSSVQEKNLLEESHKERLKDMPGCVSSNSSVPWQFSPKVSSPSTDAHSLGSSQPFLDPQNRKDSRFNQPTDSDAFKKVYKGLTDMVWWQREAACSVTNVVIQHRSGKGRCRGVCPKGDIWLLFLGPDRVGKRKMAAALSELIFGSDKKLFSMKLSSQDGVISSSWNLGPHDHEEYGMNFRGKTTLDRIAEAVRLNPFSVILLEDVDQADPLIRSKLILAMEKGRLPDSHGKEYSLGNIIFVITCSAGSENHHESVRQEVRFSEERLVAACGCPMQLLVESARFEVLIAKHKKRVSVINSMHESESKDDEDVFLGLGIGNKRKSDWIKNEQSQNDIENVKKTSKEPFVSLDLNLSVEENDVADFSTASQGHTDACQGSRDSSDLTVEQGLKCTGELFKDLSDSVDEKVVFKPFDFETHADKIVESISAKFFSIIGTEGLMEIDIKALEQILACIWFSSDGMEMFENWVERVLVRCLTEISTSCAVSVDTVVKLVLEKDCFAGERRPGVPSLPSNISVNIRTKTGQKAGAI